MTFGCGVGVPAMTARVSTGWRLRAAPRVGRRTRRQVRERRRRMSAGACRWEASAPVQNDGGPPERRRSEEECEEVDGRVRKQSDEVTGRDAEGLRNEGGSLQMRSGRRPAVRRRTRACRRERRAHPQLDRSDGDVRLKLPEGHGPDRALLRVLRAARAPAHAQYSRVPRIVCMRRHPLNTATAVARPSAIGEREVLTQTSMKVDSPHSDAWRAMRSGNSRVFRSNISELGRPSWETPCPDMAADILAAAPETISMRAIVTQMRVDAKLLICIRAGI